jgi:hypothetical protein
MNLDLTAFPDQLILKNSRFAGRLNGLKYSGDTDNDGDIDEIKFIAFFNSNKDSFKEYLNHFSQYPNLWMVRVTTKQASSLCGKKVFTRSDGFLASIDYNIDALLVDNDYYLSEHILAANKIPYKKIPLSGVSVKMTTSKSFQILKTGPNSFKTLFNSFELGAGASLFCMREDELAKNPDLIEGWKTSIKDMTKFFDEYTNGDVNFYLDQSICKEIKNYSCKEIKSMIEDSVDLQRIIFNGIGLYDEPYTALYFYHGKDIHELSTILFSVTTGSGRSKGDYTIVLKPTN